MKKGFTLIELLAVIVILAIIALIALPIILNIIGDAKEESNKRSVDLYASAIRNAMAKYQLKEEAAPTNFSEIEKYIEYEGSKVECETKEIYSNGKIYLSDCIVNGETVEYEYGIEENHLAREYVAPVKEDTKTTGIVPVVDSNGDFLPGSEFKIKVNNTFPERSFFVLSNNGDYVNLIAPMNLRFNGGLTTSNNLSGDEWYVTTDNRYGPQTVYTYLSTATSNWTNIPIIENFSYLDEGNQKNSTYGYQSVETKFDKISGDYITTITPYSSDYGNPVTYKNMRARLPYYEEIIENTSCTTTSGSCDDESLWIVDRLKKGSYIIGGNSANNYSYGYWLLSSYPGWSKAYAITYYGRIEERATINYPYYGVRPVITVLKSDLLRVM